MRSGVEKREKSPVCILLEKSHFALSECYNIFILVTGFFFEEIFHFTKTTDFSLKGGVNDR